MNSFKIEALGCKVNSYEAQSVHDEMCAKGFVATDGAADIYVVFTCAVTNVAESKTRKKINSLRRENPNAIMCVVGCYVQVNQEFATRNDIEILLGSDNKTLIVESIINYQKDGKPIYIVNEIRQKPKNELMTINSFKKQTRAYLKIQDGCNQFCSYCIIPFARGKERSIDMPQIIDNANKLVANGHKEIVLAGIHTGRYLDDLGNNLDILLDNLVKIDGLKRIRLSSIEITEISDHMIDLMAKNSKIAAHLHIPVQSCNNKILKLMNRPYTIEEFKNRVDYIRSKLPNISISTDLIVGFPSESDDDFSDTLNNIKDIKFSFLHVFPYAKKTGTKAAMLENHVDEKIKKQRSKECVALSKNLYKSYQSQFIGQSVDVLIENSLNKGFGHSSEYIPVYVSNDLNTNEIVKVTITGINDLGLVGDVVNEVK